MSNGPVVKTVQLLVVSARSWIDDRVIRLGAAVAYYSLFTLIPVLFLAVSLASIFFGQDQVDAEVEKQIADILGDDIASAVTSAFEQLQDVNEGTIVSLVTLGVLLFTATLLFVAWRSVWLPSFVAMAMLSVGASAYGLYVSAYAFRSAAGAAGSVFLGLIFVYYAAQILLYGVEIMKEQQRMIDSTSPA